MSRSALARRWRDSGIPAATRRPWLDEARAHLRKHHPTDGLAESCLWKLHEEGFDLPPESDDDVMAPLRKVVCP